MREKPNRFSKAVGAIRAMGAGTTLWHFVTSQAAAVYLWGPLFTAWSAIAGWREGIATPYLLAASSFTFGSIIWLFLQADTAVARFKEQNQKLKAIYDRSIPSCRADVTFSDGTHSTCFRIKVENTTIRKLRNCEGWLESTARFPNISPTKLFWVGEINEFSVDLIKGVPRFLQVCRIHQSNRVIVATKNEAWPIDTLDSFKPGQQYVFKIALKGDDRAETCFYSVKLDWTGNWTTAEMTPVD